MKRLSGQIGGWEFIELLPRIRLISHRDRIGFGFQWLIFWVHWWAWLSADEKSRDAELQRVRTEREHHAWTCDKCGHRNVAGIIWCSPCNSTPEELLEAAAPDLLALAEHYAEECAACEGTGTLQVGVGKGDPCTECAFIHDVLRKAKPR